MRKAAERVDKQIGATDPLTDPPFSSRMCVVGLIDEQLWRPVTAAAFLGPPSMSWLSNLYFLIQYGA